MKTPTGTEAAVCEDIASRQELGLEKYGVTVEENPLILKQWLQHAYEECLDQAVYLKRSIDELKMKTPKSDKAHDEFRLLPFARKLEVENKKLRRELREIKKELRKELRRELRRKLRARRRTK